MSFSLVFKMPLKLKNGHFVCLILTDFISGENPSCNHCIAVQKRVWLFYLLQVLVWIVCPCHAVDRVSFTYLQLKALVLRFPFTCFCCSIFLFVWNQYLFLSRTTGLYTKTLAKIIYRDMTRFSVVFLIVFIGFCGAMFMALKATGSQELFT